MFQNNALKNWFESDIQGKNKLLHPTVPVGCNSLSVSLVSASSGTTVLIFACVILKANDDVIKWKHFPRYWPALLALCAGNSPAIGELPSQRTVTQSFDVFFDLRLNKRLNKQSGRR